MDNYKLQDSLIQCKNCKYVELFENVERVYCGNLDAPNYPCAIKHTVECKYKEIKGE